MFNSIEDAILDYKAGRMLIVVDDEDRENEGDLILAAERVTADHVNFMAKHGRGLICMAITAQRAEELDLNIMVNENTALHATPFTVTIDAKKGTTTGISAMDRATTIRAVIDPQCTPEDLARPGHIFPLVARTGGVLERSGHTEATVDLARMAGLYPAGVLCEIMDDDGSMARVPRLIEFAREFDLKIITIKDLIEYRLRKERFVRPILRDVELPSRYGQFTAWVYENVLNHDQHLAVIKGNIRDGSPVLVRVHAQSVLADVFGSRHFDQMSDVGDCLEMIEREGRGVLLYLRGHDSRGLTMTPYDLETSLDSHHTQDTSKDWRTLGVGCQILVDIGVKRLRLITNNLKKYVGLEGYGLEVVDTVSVAKKKSGG